MKAEIYNLIEKYFDGETSSQEEQQIRRFFAQDNVPEDLTELIPIFRFMEDESAALRVLNEIREEENSHAIRRKSSQKALWWTAASVAACLLAAILLIIPQQKQSNANYVWVDGKRITDPELIQKYAETSLQNVEPDNNTLEEQLNFIFE